MSHPDLVSLLHGDVSNADALAAGDHLAGCVTCRDELAELTVGHAVLLGAVRTEGVRRDDALPPLRTPDRRRPRRRTVLAAVAAVVVLVAAATCTGLLLRSTDEPAAPPAYAQVRLQPVTGSGTGTVTMQPDGHRTLMTLSTAGLPDAGAHRYYYAWLLDPGTNKMLPLGQVRADGTASFDVTSGLVDAYAAVDVSVERDDGDPAHSPTSVLRGSYEGL
ncbi:anti-sigma factor [Nocardioides sp. URHA0020]|uniref:anti-sigma factor n=1 Tax=Nocardioides sp. URHA0020 TaxID=1380392 RepID=UPI00068477B1|nr:anti-sigma factor [Nocardioides sp. URHA0020]